MAALLWLCTAHKRAFLNHLEIPHATNFVPLLELGKSLGASYLSDLHVGGNAHYTSERCMQELLQCLGEIVLYARTAAVSW